MRNKYHSWTVREEKRIIEFMKSYQIKHLADELGLDYNTVMSKIKSLRKEGKL